MTSCTESSTTSWDTSTPQRSTSGCLSSSTMVLPRSSRAAFARSSRRSRERQRQRVRSSRRAGMRRRTFPISTERFSRIVPWSRVNTKGSDSSYAVHALTGAIDVMGYTEQRVMVELAGLTGGMGVTILTQQTNTPEDRTSWTDVATLGSELTAAGVTFPTTFSATAFTMRYGRWAAKVRNATAGVDVEACLVALVAEIRE